MASIDGALLELRRLDLLATGDSFIHRLDPRTKVLVTLVFLICVVSFGRYELSALVPFFIFPAAVIAVGNLPLGYLLKKVALICSFALAVGIFNPIFDRAVMVQLGPLSISAGWVSCASIVLRALLTVTAAVTLVAVTGFPAICSALDRLGMPKAFAAQLAFLYRYLFILMEEGGRASQARELRSFGRRGLGIASYSSLIGHLLLRTLQRGDRVQMAMLNRGFTGSFRCCNESRFGREDVVFLLGWSALFVILRFHNVPQLLGSFLTGQ